MFDPYIRKDLGKPGVFEGSVRKAIRKFTLEIRKPDTATGILEGGMMEWWSKARAVTVEF